MNAIYVAQHVAPSAGQVTGMEVLFMKGVALAFVLALLMPIFVVMYMVHKRKREDFYRNSAYDARMRNEYVAKMDHTRF